MLSPDTRNISLLNGVLRLDRHLAGARTGWRDIGEADKYDYNAPDISEIELITSRDGTAAKVKGNITKYVPKLEISGQEIGTFQLALQTLGLEGLLTQTGSTRAAGEPLIGAASPLVGRSYRFQDRGITALTLKQGVTTKTPGTDYVLDGPRGFVYIPVGSTITEGGGELTGAYTFATLSLRKVSIGAAKELYCSVFYTGASREGLIYDAEIWRAQVKPSATLGLITPPGANEYQRWSIGLDVLGDTAGLFGGSAEEPFGTMIEVGVQS